MGRSGKLVRIASLAGATVAGACLVILATALGYRASVRHRAAQRRIITSPNGIDTLMSVRLGGVEQSIQIRGSDRSNPVLLFLHGGPGTAWIGIAYAYQRPWEDHFTCVQWDQRGTGLSYAGGAYRKTLTVDRMIGDAEELVEKLRDEFHQDRIVLVGHSWGSTLAIMLIKRHPEWYSAYVGSGQVVDMTLNEQMSYDWTLAEANRRGEARAVERLTALGRPPWPRRSLESLSVERKYLARYGGVVYHGNGYVLLGKAALLSPDYSLSNVLAMVRGNSESLAALWDQTMSIDLRTLGPEFDVPMFFFCGRHDWNVPATLSYRYFESIRAPHKEFVWFEESAHAPMIEEPDRYADELIRRVLPVARARMN